jgi:hypothetical protein
MPRTQFGQGSGAIFRFVDVGLAQLGQPISPDAAQR